MAKSADKKFAEVIILLAGIASIVGVGYVIADHLSASTNTPNPVAIAPEQSDTPTPTSTHRPQSHKPAAEKPVTIAVPKMAKIIVGTGYETPAVPCCKVGPNLFKIDDKSGEASFGFHWSSRMSDGTENDTQNCAIVAKVTGPETPPALRTDECSVSGSNGFNGFGNYADVTTPGRYNVTITDQVSGVTGSVVVNVIP